MRVAPRGGGTPWSSRGACTAAPGPSSIQRCSESDPRFRWTTRWATPRRRAAAASAQQLVQRRLADVDRRVGPDRGEAHVGRDVVRRGGAQLVQRRARSALRRARSSARSLTSTAQHGGGGGAQRERQRDRAPAAAEVEEGAGGRGRGAPRSSSTRGARVEAAGGEDAAARRRRQVAAGEADAHLPALVGAGRGGGEVVVVLAHRRRHASGRAEEMVRPAGVARWDPREEHDCATTSCPGGPRRSPTRPPTTRDPSTPRAASRPGRRRLATTATSSTSRSAPRCAASPGCRPSSRTSPRSSTASCASSGSCSLGVWTEGTADDAENSLRELAALAETAGSEVLDGRRPAPVEARPGHVPRLGQGRRAARHRRRRGRRHRHRATASSRRASAAPSRTSSRSRSSTAPR